MSHSTEHHKLNNKAGFAQAFACFFILAFLARSWVVVGRIN